MKNNEIVSVNAQEFGLTEETAKGIQQQFQPMLDKMVELENEFNAIMSFPIEAEGQAEKAKKLRAKYVKVRTGTAEIHKTQKAFYLNGGRFIDGWKNAQIFASQNKEQKLEEIEKWAENKEKERLERINNERAEALKPFVEDVSLLNLASMEEDVWKAYFSVKKKDFEDKVAAEKKVEEEKLLKLKQEEEAREQQRIENAKLKAEAEAREKQILAERKANEEKAKKLQAEAEAKLAEERAKAKAEADKLAKETEEQLRFEREAKAKIKAELIAKQHAEAEEIGRKNAEIIKAKKEAEKLAKAPIKERLNIWVDSFEIIPLDGIVENQTADLIKERFEGFKNWAKLEIEKI